MLLTASAILFGRAGHGAEGAEDAAVAGEGAEEGMAASALVEEEARVGGHGEGGAVVAVGAGEGGFERELHDGLV